MQFPGNFPAASCTAGKSGNNSATFDSTQAAGNSGSEVSLSEDPPEYLISIETVSELVCIVKDGRIIQVNEGGIHALGARSKTDIVGRLFEDLLASDYRGLVADGFELLLSERAAIPLKMVRLDGSLVEIELMIRPYTDSIDGSVAVFGRDITEQKEAAIALLERERRISAIMENVADGIIVIDEQGQIESINRAAETMFGYAAGEVVGCNVKMLVDTSDRKRHDRYLRKYLESATSAEIAMVFRNSDLMGRRKDGSSFPIGLAVGEMRSGIKRKFIGSISDITERKQREAALRESETRLRLIVDNAPLKITLKDESGRYVLVNKPFAEAYGTDPDRLQGQSVQELHGGEAGAALAAEDFKVLETKTVTKEERRVPGTTDDRFEHVFRFPIPGPHGAPAGVGTIISDITDQKNLEAQLRESEKLNALGQLAGGVAHDFNNLLMVAGGFAKRALADLTDRERVEMALSEIVAAMDKAAGLTKQLLAFGRRQVLETKVVRVATLVSELKTMLSPLLGETVMLTVDAGDDGMCVETDPGQLSQLLINLAINARDAMPGGGAIKVGVAVSEVSEALRIKFPKAGFEPYAKFSVQDDGVGMNAETQARIFEPFFTTKEQGKGTGLGLAMVYGFVQQSQGMIDVTSAPGKGTTVEVYLPLADSPPEVLTTIERELLTSNGETILLAEDDDALRHLAAMTLEEVGYTVLVACDGFEALEIEDEHEGSIDLLLSDVVMPNLGGPDLCRAIRESRPDIKVILMSGYPSRGEIKSYDLPAGVPLLQKPFDPESLARNVWQMLDGNFTRKKTG